MSPSGCENYAQTRVRQICQALPAERQRDGLAHAWAVKGLVQSEDAVNVKSTTDLKPQQKQRAKCLFSVYADHGGISDIFAFK